MARLGGHSGAKYVTGACTATSRDRDWRGLVAERWRHAEGDLGAVVLRDTEVIVMLDGNLRVRRRGDGRLQEHDAEPGTVWICPSGITEDMIHLYGEIRDSIHLHLPAQPVSRACIEELGLDPATVQLRYEGGFRDPTIETIARAISAELGQADPMRSDPIGRLMVESMSAALGVYLVRHYSNRSPGATPLPVTRGGLDGRRLARVSALIEDRLAGSLTLADLAAEASLSPFHFARCFKEATGTSPHRYVLARRIERGTRLLSGPLPIAEIAARCGFSSQAHFSDAFRRAVGMTPGAYRAGHQHHG